jgi:hypothetical protein
MGLGRSRESSRREAAGRRNWPEAMPEKMSGRKRADLPGSIESVYEGHENVSYRMSIWILRR